MIISLVLSVNCGSFEQSILNCCVPGTWTISPCLADMLMGLRHSLFPSACLTSGSLCDLYWIYVETSKATSVVLDFLSFSCSFMWIFFFSTFFILLLNSQHNVHFYRISDILKFSLLSSVTLVNPQPLQFFLSSPMGCYSKLHLTLFFS